MVDIQAARSLKIQEEKHWPEKGIKLKKTRESGDRNPARPMISPFQGKPKASPSSLGAFPGVLSVPVLSLVACTSQLGPTNSFFSLSFPFRLSASCLQDLSKHGKGFLNKITLRGRVTQLDTVPGVSNTFNKYCTRGLARILDYLFLESNLYK